MTKNGSRTSKSIKNSSVALVFYFINLVLQFYSRKIFLDYLGAEVLGLNTTATNLLQFLNLAELGVGSAVSFTLYKPLAENDTKTINEIVSLQGWLYRRIAWVVIASSVVIMIMFPWIFSKMPLPLWYAYGSFGVLLFSALLSYFVNYTPSVFSADQKEYKIKYSYKAAMSMKILCQLLAIRFLDNGYVWWLVLEFVFAILASVALNIVINRTYPCLKVNLFAGRDLIEKYPSVLKKVKQLFFHKIGGLALCQISPIIIYAYTTLTIVALYGNYMLVILGVQTLMNAIFSSMDAGIGNLVAEGDRKRIWLVFEELLSVRFLFSTTMCFGVFMLTPVFIKLWIGSEYLMDSKILMLMSATLFISLDRTTVHSYINAYGLFGDIGAPIIESIINIGLSIVLGYYFGIYGVLLGVLLSLIIVVLCWKPYYLFRNGLHVRLSKYVILEMKHIVSSLVCIAVTYPISKQILFSMKTEVLSLVIYGFIIVLMFFIVQMILLCCIDRGMRAFMFRLINILRLNRS